MALVSLYKSPDQYMLDMIGSVQAQGSIITDFNVGSVSRTTFEALGAALSDQSLTADRFQSDSHLATATGDALDAKGADYLVPRKAAVAAAGSITISRAAAGQAVTLVAGFSQLQTQPAPGQTPVLFITTQDAVFSSSDTSKTVSAVALTAGVAGNIADQTVLIPVNPVSGFPTASSFKASGAFTNGVDTETDDAYRARIPIAVQGRLNGTAAALQAAAMGVPGVASANVLKAGDTRANATTVAAGNVEVYYEGSAGLLTAVQSACANAGTLNQQITVFTANIANIVAGCTVTAHAGVDTVALGASVAAALQTYIVAQSVGGKIGYSGAISAVLAVPNVVSVNLPFADFRLSTAAPGTAADVQLPADTAAQLLAANTTVAVVTF